MIRNENGRKRYQETDAECECKYASESIVKILKIVCSHWNEWSEREEEHDCYPDDKDCPCPSVVQLSLLLHRIV